MNGARTTGPHGREKMRTIICSEHNGEDPEFVMRTVGYHCRALNRQIAEAVRIGRRGGAGSKLNSKAEFDRCKIPRLIVEEQDKKEIDKA